MRHAHSERTTTVAGWITLVVTLVVCGLGLKLTVLQYHGMSGVLLDAERRSAESVRTVLDGLLDAEESRLLALIHAAAADSGRLAELAGREPLIDEPFVLAPDGTLLTPLSGTGSSLLTEPAPAAIEQAMAVVSGPAPAELKLAALHEASESPQLGPGWRRLARAQALAILARSGDAATAAAGYRELADGDAGVEADGARPTRLELLLAASDAARQAGDSDAALEWLHRGMAEVAGGSRIRSFAQDQFFVREARRRLEQWQAPEPPAMAAIAALHAEKRLSLEVFDAMKEWMLARTRAGALTPGDSPRPHHHVEERRTQAGTRLVVIAWSPSPAPPGPQPPAPQAVGFRVSLTGLAGFIERQLAGVEGRRFELTMAPPARNAGFIELAALSRERSFLRLGLGAAAWDAVVSDARRPFAIAGALIGFLMLLLILGLVAFLRGLRREMALSRMKTELVANVSHELKTPLALIRLFGETLLLGRGDPESRERYCRIITRESERLTHLISSVLSFASIEAGKKRYDLKPCDLVQVIRETYESYRFHLDEKGFAHRFEDLRAAGAPAEALADAHAVAEAFINLLDNAVKYSGDRKDVTVRIDTTRLDAAAPCLRVAVIDQGVGIGDEDRSRVFDDYYRTKEARAMGTRGSGLGLSLVRHILDAHQGDVELESRPGEGSTFRLVFPLCRTRSAENVRELAPAGAPPGAASDKL